MSYHIKKLGVDDISLAQEVCILFKKVFGAETGETAEAVGPKKLPDEEYLKQLLATPTFHMFAAVADGAVVGGLTAYEFAMYLKQEKEAYLYDLAVDEGHRRQGIARALIEAAKDYARTHDISTLFVEAHEKDAAAIEFYSSLNAEMEKVAHFNIPTHEQG